MNEQAGNTTDRLWTDEDVAEFLQVSPATVRKWAKMGRLPVLKVGSLNRFDREEIKRWPRPVEPEAAPDSEAAA
jgi:excisionase family DNA binding protein